LAERNGDFANARILYGQAGEAEEEALRQLDSSKVRTLGVSAVSNVALYFKAGRLEEAEYASYRFLSMGLVPEFAQEQLRGLLQSVWSERVRMQAGVGFAPGQVTVSVRGGEIIEGGAPLDLVVEKAQTVQALLYRTAEFIKELPYRIRGGPEPEIQQACRPWLFQTSPGSYQFAVAVQEPAQGRLFGPAHPSPPEIMEKLLRVLRASVESPEEELSEMVPDVDYRSTFLKLTRNLAPSGKRFRQLELRSASELKPIVLDKGTRRVINGAIRAFKPQLGPGEEEVTLEGILRAVHLDLDWIEVKGENTSDKIFKLGNAVDDVIGPMVNHPVSVQVVRHAKGRLYFRDIEATDS
jgi:hypothetical protein